MRFLLFSTLLAKGSALASRNALGQGFGGSLHYYGNQRGQSIRKPERVFNGANTAVNVGTGQYGADDLQGLWIAAEQEHSDSKETSAEVSAN